MAYTLDKMNLTIDAVINFAKISRFSLEARERFLAIQCRSQRFITYDDVHFNPHHKNHTESLSENRAFEPQQRAIPRPAWAGLRDLASEYKN